MLEAVLQAEVQVSVWGFSVSSERMFDEPVDVDESYGCFQMVERGRKEKVQGKAKFILCTHVTTVYNADGDQHSPIPCLTPYVYSSESSDVVYSNH